MAILLASVISPIMPAPTAVLYMRAAMLGFLVGTMLVAYASSLEITALLLLLCAICTRLLREHRMLAISLALCACAGAMALLHALDWRASRLPASCTREPVIVAGTVTSLPRRTVEAGSHMRQRFELEVSSLEPLACRGPRRILLSYYGPERLNPGDGWSFSARLRPPRGLANPGSRDFSAWYAETGIHAVGSAGSMAKRRSDLDQPLGSLHHRQRQGISVALEQALGSGEPSAVLRAISVADKGGIDHRLWTRLQGLGVNHLLVISGLHVGMVAAVGLLLGGAVARLMSLCTRQHLHALAPLTALTLAALYTALAGFSVATSRAFLMLAVAVFATLLYRRTTPWTVIFALVVIVLANPLALLGSGLALSFSAVLALVWLASWSRPGMGWRNMLAVHAYMALVMLPMGALWFGGASVIAAPANLLLIPFFTFLLVPVALLAAVAHLLGLAAFADTLWQLAAWMLGPAWLGHCLDTLAKAYLPLPASWPAVVLGATGIAVSTLPVAPRRRLLSLLLLAPLFLLPQGTSRPMLAVLDVGQGTAVVFSSAGRTLLYDTGGGNPAGANLAQSVVLPYLQARGITALDTLVISHGDADHAAGAAAVRAAMPPRVQWRGGDAVPVQGEIPCRAGQGWRWPDGTHFHFLSPAGAERDSRNNRSCVLMIEVAGQRILLAGDIESGRELQLQRYWRDDLRADLLLVGHHGSATSTAQSWLNRVAPDLALLSYGWGNRFGHPHPDVSARLSQQGVSSESTALGGALELTLESGGEWQVRRYREIHENWRL